MDFLDLTPDFLALAKDLLDLTLDFLIFELFCSDICWI